jgi:hypothetical protein
VKHWGAAVKQMNTVIEEEPKESGDEQLVSLAYYR